MREAALRLATEEENRRKTDPIETHERSIIILGSKGVVSATELGARIAFTFLALYISDCVF